MTATILIKDTAEGKCEVDVSFSTPTKPWDEATPAQKLALIALGAIKENASGFKQTLISQQLPQLPRSGTPGN